MATISVAPRRRRNRSSLAGLLLLALTIENLANVGLGAVASQAAEEVYANPHPYSGRKDKADEDVHAGCTSCREDATSEESRRQRTGLDENPSFEDVTTHWPASSVCDDGSSSSSGSRNRHRRRGRFTAVANDAGDDKYDLQRLYLWLRGFHGIDEPEELLVSSKEAAVVPIRARVYEDCRAGDCTGQGRLGMRWTRAMKPLMMRGGGDSGRSMDEDLHHEEDQQTYNHQASYEAKLADLSKQLGPDFAAALRRNHVEHDEDCRKSCELYYCFEDDVDVNDTRNASNTGAAADADFATYSMGAVPPEDFASQFGTFPFDLIKVSRTPLFPPQELDRVIGIAKQEGLDHHEFPSGKYRLGGNWLDDLPETRAWFNRQLQHVVFPTFARLFPEVVSSPRVLRAHSVSLLKYNASHPRTDVHVDNGILALTVALSPLHSYEGGGTFYEHMDAVLPMEAGHATFRPGSVRHGGHKVASGTRYVLGCFLLLQDRVEHVRRLKNRGSDLRRQGDLEGAMRHFEWALAINPRCTTCLKDAAEVLIAQGRYRQAEDSLRSALELLENKDSDALFSLGLVLSEQGRHDESVVAYRQGLTLNGEDAELCYNLAIKVGAMGRTREEMDLYDRAVHIDPNMGGAWLNWGTALAEADDLESAEAKFLRAIECRGGQDHEAVSAKAMMNLSILYYKVGERSAQSNDMETAKLMATKAGSMADDAKSRLDSILQSSNSNSDQFKSNRFELEQYQEQFPSLRVRCHRLMGQLLASTGSLAEAEAEFAKATESFPDDPMAWMMLSRVQQLQGNESGAAHAMATAASLQPKQM